MLRGGGEGVELAQLVAHEAVALHEVEGRIAGERELGQHDQIRALRGRARGGFLGELAVAGEVANGGIDLSEGHAHGAGS